MYRKAQKPTFNANGNASRQSDTSLEFFSEGIQKNQTKEDTILQLKELQNKYLKLKAMTIQNSPKDFPSENQQNVRKISTNSYVHSETSTDLESEISNQFWESGMENSVNQIEHSFPWSSGISEKAVGELLFPVIINGLILYPRDGHIPNDQSFYSSRNNGRPKFTLKSPPPLKIPRKNSDKIFLKSKWFQKGHDVWQQPKSSRCYSIHSSFQKDLSYFDNFNEKASGDETRIKLFSGSQIESEAPSIIEGQNGFQKEPSSFWNNSGSIYDGNIHQMRFGQPISSSFTSYYSTELSYRGTERQQMTYPPILQSTNQTQKKRKFAPTEHHWGSKGFSKFSLH